MLFESESTISFVTFSIIQLNISTKKMTSKLLSRNQNKLHVIQIIKTVKYHNLFCKVESQVIQIINKSNIIIFFVKFNPKLFR